MLLNSAIEAAVDAVRCSAAQVRKILGEAKAIQDASTRIRMSVSDQWDRYKMAKSFWQKAERVEQEARKAYDEVGNHRRDLPEAIAVHADPQIAFAARVAEAAYDQATADADSILRLVGETKRNCRGACEGYF